MANYDIKKELKDIHDRMYGTQFEQDRIIIKDAIDELETKPLLAVATRNEEILNKLRQKQNQIIELRKHKDRDYLRYGYEIDLINRIIEEILS